MGSCVFILTAVPHTLTNNIFPSVLLQLHVALEKAQNTDMRIKLKQLGHVSHHLSLLPSATHPASSKEPEKSPPSAGRWELDANKSKRAIRQGIQVCYGSQGRSRLVRTKGV